MTLWPVFIFKITLSRLIDMFYPNNAEAVVGIAYVTVPSPPTPAPPPQGETKRKRGNFNMVVYFKTRFRLTWGGGGERGGNGGYNCTKPKVSFLAVWGEQS